MDPKTLVKWFDRLLTAVPFLGNFLDGKKSAIGLLAYVAIQVLFSLGKLDAESAMQWNLYVSIWSGVGVTHKLAKKARDK